jgi:hypothetical protein
MGWKSILGAAAVFVAAVVGCWWVVAASAASPAPVIGPAVVVTPVTGASARPSSSAVAEPDGPAVTGDEEPPEAVDPRWVRPVDDDGHQRDGG